MRLIDSHCHLNYKGLVEQQPAILERARAAGVFGFLNISTKEEEWPQIAGVTDREPDVWATVGVHPHYADDHLHVTSDTLVAAALHPKVIGLGETGLDYHYDYSDRAAQEAVFRRHIAAAKATGLPLIVHTRDAEEDTQTILREELSEDVFSAVIHCFTGSKPFATAMLNLGFYISLSGIVTFKNAKTLHELATMVPGDRLLVETDSPFLAPVPHRGAVCEPAFVRDTLRFVAELRGVSADRLAEQTTANFFRLFSKAAA